MDVKQRNQFHRDVFEIAKYLCWFSDVGNEKAREIIHEIHEGKYGSHQGIWIQYGNLLDEIEGERNGIQSEIHGGVRSENETLVRKGTGEEHDQDSGCCV